MNTKNIGTSDILNHKEKYDRIIESLFIILFFIAPLSRAGVNILLPILTIAWFVKKLKYHGDPEEKARFPEINKWVAILGVAFVVSFINVVNYSAAIENFIDEYILFALIFLISLDVIKSKELVRKLFWAAITSSIIVATWGLYEHFGKGYARISSTFNLATQTGTYFLIIVLLSISFILFNNKLNWTKVLISCLYTLLNLSCLIFTGSRGAWVGFFAGFILLLIFAIMKRKGFNFKKLIVLFLIFILAATFVDMGWVIGRLDSINDLSNSSNQQRIMMVITGLRMLKDHLLFGMGIGQFPYIYLNYKLKEANVYSHIHCFYLHLAVEIGLAGFLIYLIVVYKILKTGLHSSTHTVQEQWFHYGLIGAIVGAGVHNIFDFSFFHIQVVCFILILVGIWLNKTKMFEDK